MTTMQKIALVATSVIVFTLAQATQADDVLRSPKLASLQTKTVSGTAQDPDLAHPGLPKVYLTPRMAANLPRIAARSATNDPDLAHPHGLVTSGNNYAREIHAKQMKALGLPQFELAPLKSSR